MNFKHEPKAWAIVLEHFRIFVPDFLVENYQKFYFSSSSASLPARAPPSSSPSHRTIGSLMRQKSISIGASNHYQIQYLQPSPRPVV